MIRRVAAGVGVNILDKAIVALTQLTLVPVLANAWGLKTYGLWLVMFTAPSFLAVSDFGFATAAGTKMTMAVAQGRLDQAVTTFQSAWLSILKSSGVLAAIAILIVAALPVTWIGSSEAMTAGDVRLTLLLLMTYGIVAVQGSIFFAGFKCAGLFSVGAFWNALIILIETAAVITVVMLGAGPAAAAAAFVCGRLIGLLGQQILLRRKVPWLKVGTALANRTEARSLLAPAGAVMLLPIAQALYLQGSALALSIAVGQSAVPSFTAARTLSRVGLQMCWLVSTPIMPEFTAASARGDTKTQSLMVFVTLFFSTVLVIPYAVGFAALGPRVISIWTHGKIHAAWPITLALSVSIICGGFWYPLSNLILALNRHASYTFYYVLLAVLVIPLTWFLSLHVGAAGAGIGMACLDVGMLVVLVFLTRRHLLRRGELKSGALSAYAWITHRLVLRNLE